MADTRLIIVPLTGLRTSEEDQVLGSEYNHKGKTYRFVKNAGITDLQTVGACLTVNTSIANNIGKRVVAPSGADPSTGAVGSVLNAAGVPMTAIQQSGSDTGDHGWVQVAGSRRVTMTQSATAADQYVGALAIASQALDGGWGRPILAAGLAQPATATPELFASRRVMLVDIHASTGAATTFSAVVDIQCN